MTDNGIFFFYLEIVKPDGTILWRNWKLDLSDNISAKKGRKLTEKLRKEK